MKKDIFLNPYDRQSISNINYRPIRLAFLVPSDDSSMLLLCIKINSALWGGAFNFLLPYEKIVNKPDNFWVKILSALKPDSLIVPNTCDDTVKNDLKERFDLFHVEKIQDCFERKCFRTIHFGTHIYSLFHNEKYYSNKEKRKQSLFFNFSEAENKQDLRYAITFGLLESNKSLPVSHSYFKEGLPYDSYANLLELKKSSLSPSSYLSYVINWAEGKFNGFFDYTIISNERFSRYFKSSPSNHLVGNPLLILSNGSLDDYMLASNLRYRIINNYPPFPILINSNNEYLKEEINILNEFFQKKKYSCFNIFSLSCSGKEIESVAGNFKLKFKKLDFQEILRLFDAQLEFSYNTTEQFVLQKHVNLLLRKPQFFSSLGQDDYFMSEIKFSNYKIPYKTELNEKHWSATKVFSGGFRILCHSNEDENIFLMLPEVDDILYTLMVKKDIWPQETPIRKKMKALSSYFENFWELSIFSTKEIQKLFFELRSPLLDESKKNNESAGVFSYGDICKSMSEVPFTPKFPSELKAYLISKLIEKKILFRGALVRCPNCYFSEWKSLNKLQNENICNGCGQSITFSDISKTDWTYRLNRLFAESFDLTVFLTLMRLIGFKHQDLDKVMGYNFGFKADISKNKELVEKLNGTQEIEMDFVIIDNGKITIGECKQNPKDFTDTIITNILNFAKYINCDKVVFSSIGKLDTLREKISGMNLSGLPEVEILDENDLSYFSAYLLHNLDRIEKFKSIDKKYAREYKELKHLSTRRKAFIEQYVRIAKHRTGPKEVIGDYFTMY